MLENPYPVLPFSCPVFVQIQFMAARLVRKQSLYSVLVSGQWGICYAEQFLSACFKYWNPRSKHRKKTNFSFVTRKMFWKWTNKMMMNNNPLEVSVNESWFVRFMTNGSFLACLGVAEHRKQPFVAVKTCGNSWHRPNTSGLTTLQHSSYGRSRNNWTLQCKINFNW